MKTSLLLLFICYLAFGSTSNAQEEVLIKGRILNDSIDSTALNVVNLNLKIGTITKPDGSFEIRSKVHDTLLVSGVQYESREFRVSKKMMNTGKLELYLIPKVTVLDEVKISTNTLSGNLKQDAITTGIKPQITATSLGLPVNARPVITPEERKFYGATSGAGAFGALLNAISGRVKILKKHLEVARLQAKIEKNRNEFSDSLYMKQLHIPEVLIEDFVYYVFEDEEAVKEIEEENVLELFQLMLSKSEPYLRSKQKEGVMPTRFKN